jgi:crotonobetainyl-CoA:carnitine CoA-transferase CaiB-like acyl-CoA transferase
MAESLLSGVRVVEVAHPLTEYAGLVLAGLGAEVFLVEAPEGSTTRRREPRVPGAGESGRGSMAFLARNVGKTSVIVDPESPDDTRLLADLCLRSDLVLAAEGSSLCSRFYRSQLLCRSWRAERCPVGPPTSSCPDFLR